MREVLTGSPNQTEPLPNLPILPLESLNKIESARKKARRSAKRLIRQIAPKEPEAAPHVLIQDWEVLARIQELSSYPIAWAEKLYELQVGEFSRHARNSLSFEQHVAILELTEEFCLRILNYWAHEVNSCHMVRLRARGALDTQHYKHLFSKEISLDLARQVRKALMVRLVKSFQTQPRVRRGFRAEVRAWKARLGLKTNEQAAKKLAVSIDVLKSIMTDKGEPRYGEDTLQRVLQQIGYQESQRRT